MHLKIQVKMEIELSGSPSPKMLDAVNERIACCQEELELILEQFYQRRFPDFGMAVTNLADGE